MKYWDMGKYAQAEEFNLANFDPKYAPAYAGLALTAQKASTASDAETAKWVHEAIAGRQGSGTEF